MSQQEIDPCSQANLDAWTTLHIDLNLTANFEEKKLKGFVVLKLKALKTSNKITLDTRDLNILKTHLEGNTDLLQFQLDGAHEAFGSALHIQLKDSVQTDTVIQLVIHYETSPNSSGLQWLPPAQTEGKKYPYLFSQFQAIHCRSGVPCQDSPAVKASYTATIRVPKPLVCLMSAVPTGKQEEDSHISYSFIQKVPIPSYLIAIVVGNLTSKEIGPRTKVWTEEAKLEASAYEFAETEQFIATGEKLLTPYEWGRYDLLILPGSFPYGGMENPCLSFITPTLLAGDRSLASVVIHEISHSWTGNLVTNRNWEHFWLNEGFTVYVERKIIGRLYGEPTRHLDAIGGAKALDDSIKLYGQDHEFTKLVPSLKGGDPDDAFSSVPYEKGFQFLFYLETVVGAERFENFLREWVKKNAFKTATSDDFKNFFLENFGKESQIVSKVDWDAWFYKPGAPPVDVVSLFDTTLANSCIQLADRWLKENGQGATKDDIKGWHSEQLGVFLKKIELSETILSVEVLKNMDSLYNFTASRNSEVRFSWYSICIKSEYDAIFPHVVQFLKEQGRMKFVRPLYRALFKSPKGKQLALDTFKEWRENYHNIAQKMLAKDLGLS